MEISNHVSSRTIFDAYFPIGDSVGDEVVSDVDVSRTLAAGSFAVVFEFDGTLVVLVTDVVLNLFLLGFQKVSTRNHLGKDIVHSHQFGFCGTLGVQLLFAGLREGYSLAHGHGSAGMALHVIVDSEGGIDMPLHLAGFVHCENQW